METKDLRLGNLVMRKSGNCTKVLAIYDDSIHVACEPPLKSQKGMSIPIRTVSGIPLTPELLEQCGFKSFTFSEDGEDVDYLTADCYTKMYGEKEFNLNVDNNNLMLDNWATPILFLHQLQNVFYAITCEELEVNLPQPA